MNLRTTPARNALILAMLVVSGTACATIRSTSNGVSEAIADRQRPDADRALDSARHPAELLAFLNIRPGQIVADIWPGDYWDRLFASIVGPSGKVYAVHLVEGDRDDKIVTPQAGSMTLPEHRNVVAVVAHANTLSLPTKADLIWMRQNYHDLYDPFMGPSDVGAFNRAVFKALKPGGRFVVIDHVAPEGSRIDATNTTHRIDPAVVKADMATAGFRFIGESEVLRNRADAHTAKVFDPSVKGHTDQFVYVFQRP